MNFLEHDSANKKYSSAIIRQLKLSLVVFGAPRTLTKTGLTPRSRVLVEKPKSLS